MTPQEAIQAMKFYKEKLYNGIFNDKIGAFDVAISALEKQIPKKLRVDDEGWLCCPKCDETFFLHNRTGEKNKKCGICGQALDWSDTE